MKDYSIMLATLLLTLVAAGSVFADLNDVDQADSSDTSSTGGQDNNMEGSEGTDPNLLNPQKGQGYGHMDNPWKTTLRPRNMVPPTPKRTLKEQSIRAIMQFAIIVGVALLVGCLFMAMVGLEILCDKCFDKYRECIKKPKELPDIERLHPAELVGTFARYK